MNEPGNCGEIIRVPKWWRHENEICEIIHKFYFLWRHTSVLYSRRVRTHEKNSGETVRRLGTIIQSNFCAQSGASIRSDLLEMVWWESVPRGFSTHAWKLSSQLFSRPDWLPLGLRGWWQSSLIARFRTVVYELDGKTIFLNTCMKGRKRYNMSEYCLSPIFMQRWDLCYVVFLIKFRWPATKSIYDFANTIYCFL